MQIMPVISPWNERVDQRAVRANSNAMITQITNDLASSRRTLRPFFEMNYVLVPDTQPRVPIQFVDYPDESDLDGGTYPRGSYPIPANQPIEEWPVGTGGLTLQQWQQDVNNNGVDRHSITVAPGLGQFWETWQAKLAGNTWQASNGAKWNLNSNALRPAGWTSADAAGLPLFPALVRYDECQRGMVEHALRLVVKRTRLGPIYPATHSASAGNLTDPKIPAMGERLRLKASFTIPASWTKEEKAVLLGLKKYGAIVADNGGFFCLGLSGQPLRSWLFRSSCHDRHRKFRGGANHGSHRRTTFTGGACRARRLGHGDPLRHASIFEWRRQRRGRRAVEGRGRSRHGRVRKCVPTDDQRELQPSRSLYVAAQRRRWCAHSHL